MRVRAVLAIIVLTIAAASAAAAADGPSSIRGIAIDQSGGVLPGVSVTASPAAAPHAEPLLQVTDADGRFTFDDLAPGTYTIVLSLPGFEDRKYDAIAVPAADELRAVMALATLSETVTVRASVPIAMPRENIGEQRIEQESLREIPLANDRFEDALPLLPGIVRGPDGLLNMNGARADQSAVRINGINMTDPVTNHFAVRLPLEAIESLNVHAGVYSAAFGNAAGGVTDIVTRPGEDKRQIQFQNLMPRFRIIDGRINGVDSFTPRLRVAGAIEPGRLWYSEAVSYRFVRTHVRELEPRDRAEQKVQSFDSVTQLDYAMSAGQHLTGTFVVFPSDIDNAGIDTLHPFDATPDLKQRGWIGAVAHRAVLSSHSTLSTALAVKEFDMTVAPKHDAASVISPSGVGQNYFNRFDRDSRRFDASSAYAVSVPDAAGSHLFRTGGQLAYTTYDGIDASQTVNLARANGSTFRTIEFNGASAVGASNTAVSGFAEDEWAIGPQVTVHGGVRYGYEQIAGDHTLAPRADVAIRLLGSGRTVLKSGVGRFYDALPLNAADFDRQQSRRITDYDTQGNIARSIALINRSADLQTPATTAWNVEVDQMIAADLVARVGYRRTRGSNQLVVDPNESDGELFLSSRGATRSREIETTLRRQFKNGSHVTASYVRSKTEGDLNDFVSLFGDLRHPIITANEYGRQAFDTPNRFLFWGVVNLPHAIAIAPTLEYRNGFPYTVFDEDQHVVGARNDGGRYPNLFTLDLAATKDLRILKHRVRAGLQVFNLTDHFNPQDVQNNTASASYGEFANSVRRQVRAKFVVLF